MCVVLGCVSACVRAFSFVLHCTTSCIPYIIALATGCRWFEIMRITSRRLDRVELLMSRCGDYVEYMFS